MKKNIMKKLNILLFVFLSVLGFSQTKLAESQEFWNNLQKHCGKSYEGKITNGGKEGDGFTGKRLVMQVLSCSDKEIRIPFYVGDDKSRTWVLTKNKKNIIRLKHDHRHQDGSEDKVTQYGGDSPNIGFKNLQMFPADNETAKRIPYASTNIWWIGLEEKIFTYNLRKIGTDRVFSVEFDLANPIEFNERPWGWKNKK